MLGQKNDDMKDDKPCGPNMTTLISFFLDITSGPQNSIKLNKKALNLIKYILINDLTIKVLII